VSAEAQLAYRNKSGLGPQAWWWGAGGNLGYAYFSDNNRSNFYLTGDLVAGKRIGQWVNVSGGYALDQAAAGNAVYSISGHGPKLAVDVFLGEKWLLYANWNSRTGDSWLTALWPGIPAGTDNAPPVQDSSFASAGDYWAYRRNSNGTITKLGANYVFDDKSSIDVSYLKRSVQATGTNVWYYNDIYAISYVRDL
jgi:hypothetical protein